MPFKYATLPPFVIALCFCVTGQPADAGENAPPVGSPDFYRVDSGRTLMVSAAKGPLSNDADTDGDSLAAVLVSGPRHGALILKPSGRFSYTPGRKYFGLDSFVYRARDGTAQSAPTTVFLAVHAPCRLEVLNFGPYVDGNAPGEGIAPERLFELLAAVAPYAKGIRTYGMDDGLEAIGPMARQMGFEFIALGAFIGAVSAANDAQVSALVDAALAGDADMLIVGNEALRGVSEATLIGYLREVKGAVDGAGLGIPVTYSEDVDVLLDYPAVIAECDVLCVNVYPFWRRMTNDTAATYVHCCYSELIEIAGDREIVIAETGWPHKKRIDATPKNAGRYLKNVVSWATENNVRVFYFEAFDEPWKQRLTGNAIEAHWGILKPDGRAYRLARSVLRCRTMADNWSGHCGPGDAELLVTYVPVCGDANDKELAGIVFHAQGGDYKIAAYVRVEGRWYSKPTLDAPYTGLKCGGAWAVDVGTGAGDASATEIAVAVVPADFNAPPVNWELEIPQAVIDAALDLEVVTRCPESSAP